MVRLDSKFVIGGSEVRKDEGRWKSVSGGDLLTVERDRV